MKRPLLTVVSLAAVAAPLRAQAVPRSPPARDSAGARPAPLDTSAVTPEAIEAGRRIFHSQGGCAACHGSALEGTAIAPTLRSHAWRDARGGELDAIYRVVSRGVPETVMGSHPGTITDQMARQVAAYVWAVNHRGAKP